MRGFTLIELIVVVSILVIISVGMSINYFSFDSRQKLRNESKEIVTMIDKARTMAISLEYPDGCLGLESYIFTGSADTGKFEITANCSSGSYVVESVDLLRYTTMSAPLSIEFLPSTGYLSGGENFSFTLTDKTTSQLSATLTVDALAVDVTKIRE